MLISGCTDLFRRQRIDRLPKSSPSEPMSGRKRLWTILVERRADRTYSWQPDDANHPDPGRTISSDGESVIGLPGRLEERRRPSLRDPK